MLPERRTELVVLAGPNGSGKSTVFQTFLAKWNLPFVNPDEIAKTLAPGDPNQVAFRAFREAMARRVQLLDARQSFVTEGIRPDPALLRDAAARGYFTRVVFVCMESPELNVRRVALRVSQGGHNIPSKTVEARYPRALESLPEAVRLADQLILVDNSVRLRAPRVVARFQSGRLVSLRRNPPAWAVGVFAKEFEEFRATTRQD